MDDETKLLLRLMLRSLERTSVLLILILVVVWWNACQHIP